jgi:hypothetical protein
VTDIDGRPTGSVLYPWLRSAHALTISPFLAPPWTCQIESNHLSDLLEDSYLTGEQASALRRRQRDLLLELRPDAVPLVDAFAIEDYALNSALGRWVMEKGRSMSVWIGRREGMDLGLGERATASPAMRTAVSLQRSRAFACHFIAWHRSVWRADPPLLSHALCSRTTTP